MNREEWLNKGVEQIAARVFAPHGITVPPVKVSCSWPGGGSARKRIGECWPTSFSKAKINEIFISPNISDPATALSILAHELVHAVDDCANGHKKPFAKMGRLIGLVGKPTQMSAGPELQVTLAEIIGDIGAYPHATLMLDGRKKQTTRMLKMECHDEACGAVWRMSSQWAIQVQCCPVCGGTHITGNENSEEDGDE